MSICYKLVTTVSVLLLITAHASSQAPELSSTLYSTISGAFVAFSNENITFTCIVRGSNVIEWSSVEYIGAGGRTLEFSSTNMPGSQDIAGETVATLVRATQDVIIESRLNIRVQSTISVATVRCQDGGTGENTEIMFRLAGNDTSVACDRRSACPDETINCVCATGNSNALAWVINRLEFTSNDPLLTRRSVNALGILTNRHSDNRIPVITSNLTLTASTDDTNLAIQCENVDGSTSNAFPINISQSCPDPSEQVITSPGNEAASTTCTCVSPIVAAVIVPIIIIIAAILAVVVVFIKYKKKEFDLQEEYSKKQTDLITDYENKENKLKKDYEDKESSLQQEHEKKQQECEKKQQEYERKQQECERKQEEYERKQHDLQQEYEKKKNLVKQECDNIKSGLQQQLKAQENEMKNKVASLQHQLESVRSAENKTKNEVASLQYQLEAARSTNTTLQSKNQSLEQKKHELQQKVGSLQRKLDDANIS